MNREDIIRMAREAGATPYINRHYPDRPTHTFNPEQLECFAALVAAAERELRSDALTLLNTIHMGSESTRSQTIIQAAIRKLQKNAPEELAAAIRARKENT